MAEKKLRLAQAYSLYEAAGPWVGGAAGQTMEGEG
jgi:hypothetical protein